nr:myb family transcription factor EFM-like [Ipomoea batatas]
MMASPSELTLDCKPHTYSMLLKSFGDHHLHPHHQNDQTLQKLEEFLSRLEEERLKIDAFKRELPLCMQLLTNAMEASRQQLQSFRANNNNHGATRPVLEEFIPLKNSSSPEGTADQKAAAAGDKANWMTTAQLWSQGNNSNNNNNESAMQQKRQQIPDKETEIGFCVSPNPQMNNNNGGAFLPFSKDRSGSCPSPTLALASPDGKDLEEKKSLEIVNLGNKCSNGPATPEQGKSGGCGGGGGGGGGANLPPPQDSQTAAGTAAQPHRKARRCWSPDLHRRFVNALQMLGGSQVATPKQIRELMKVDGLTNDEVKSHLQKYRLHTRRPGPTPQAAAAAAPQLVVLGGIWVPPEYATAAAAAHGALLGGSRVLRRADTGAAAAPTPPSPPPVPHVQAAATSPGVRRPLTDLPFPSPDIYRTRKHIEGLTLSFGVSKGQAYLDI